MYLCSIKYLFFCIFFNFLPNYYLGQTTIFFTRTKLGVDNNRYTPLFPNSICWLVYSSMLQEIIPLKSFATGLMLNILFFDLAYDALNSLGYLKGNLWVVSVLFATIIKQQQFILLYSLILVMRKCSIFSFMQFFARVIFFSVVASFILEPTLWC